MNRPHRRRGFTLVELLIVIVIIGILIALLLPVVTGAIRKANDARVVADINSLSQHLEAFKTRFGDYPPSRIVLNEGGVYDTTSTAPLASVPASVWFRKNAPTAAFGSPDITFGELNRRSLLYLRKFFPRGTLAPSDLNGDGTPDYPDFNGDGVVEPGYIYLEGPECLAFFLGGIPQPTDLTSGSVPTFKPGDGLTGFAKNPQYPFANPNATNRNPPFHEFQNDRLVDRDGDGIPGYVDPNGTAAQGSYYAYFSAYGNNGYDPNDVNLPDPDGATLTQLFKVNLGLPTVAGQPPGTTLSLGPNPYTSSVPVPPTGPVAYIKPGSFQILSAGGDGLYGQGGQYVDSGEGSKLPPFPANGDPAVRLREQDNLSSFANGRFD